MSDEIDPKTDAGTRLIKPTSGLDFLSETEKKLIAFEIAEAAKKQVTTWAKWIVGVFIAVGATLGYKTYVDIQRSIKSATDNQIQQAQGRSEKAIAAFEGEIQRAREKSDKTITSFEDEQKKELDVFKSQSQVAVTKLQLEAQKVVGSVQQRGQEAEIAILAVLENTTGPRTDLRTVNRRGRLRPIGPGISVSGLKTTAGTICCVAKNRDGLRFIITTSFNVGADANAGDLVIQPGVFDKGSNNDAIGKLFRLTDIAALIRVNDEVEVYYDIPEIGRFNGIAEADLGEKVRKFGRTTGLTSGIVTRIHVTSRIEMGGGRQLIVRGFEASSETSNFSEGGDGGAPVVNDKGQLLGIIFGGSSTDSKRTSIIAPIKPILEALGVELASGK